MAAGTLHELVSAAASAHSDRVAVTYDSRPTSGSLESLLYRDLLALSGELSHTLRRNCSPSPGVIGLYFSDDLFIPVWILGILQAPAAYVPLDPEAPGLLSATVMRKCGLKYCAVRTDLLQRFQTAVAKHMSAEVLVALPKFKLTLVRVELLPVAEQRAGGDDEGLAYVLHTSGTTGAPKVVRVPHKCILPNILHLRSLFQMSAEDVVVLASPLTFDPSVVDIFLALSSGARLLIVPSAIKKVPGRLARLLFRDHGATVLQATPTLLGRFGRRLLRREVLAAGSSLRVLALGGEACPSPALLRSWRHEDNGTRVYNLYGVTEVSCWASCHGVPPALLRAHNTADDEASSVPLGTPLMDTVLEVRDEQGRVITEGEGQVFIGGADRVCLLDGEEAAVPGTMRATGDWVSVRDAQLYYLGRRDRIVKRHGKRVNLDGVQQLICGLPEVEACAVGLCEGTRLLAFVVPSAPGDQSARQSPPPAPEPRHAESPPPAADRHLSRLIASRLSLLLPSHSVPDALVPVPALHLTPHGKVDMEALMTVYQRQRQRRGLACPRGDGSALKQTLWTLWQDTLGLGEEAAVDGESRFLLSGGDSLKALHLCEDVLAAAGVASPGLLEVILDGTFADVLRHVTEATPEGARKRSADPLAAVPAKTERKERPVITEEEAGEGPRVRAPGRGGAVLDLSLSWSSDTGRCVDASPVLLVHGGTDERAGAGKTTVFIGSHSHRVQALDLDSGGLLWERVLGDRIEASAAVSHCGTLVVVGCYDGRVYFLCAASGETRWTFQTGDAVKSRPAVDPRSGLVMVGSHDGHVYALDPKLRRCVWRRHCGGGPVFSSPHLQPSLRRLYAATLRGHVLCLDPDSGDVLWSERTDAPVFSSPGGPPGRVAFGSVDGNIRCLSGSSGELVWQFGTKGPVFSSPRVTPDGRRLLCGSHDGHLYCLDSADGSLAWAFRTPAKVYATACAFDGSAAGRSGTLVGVASTDGTVWILDGESGRALASHALPGELFSSPVVHKQSLVIGCRNDYVYCLKLSAKAEA